MRHNIPRALQLHPTLAVSYLIVNFQRKPFQDRRLREVIALAYDREILCNRILRIGDVPAYHFVPPGVANYPQGAHLDFQALTREQRLAKAKLLMAQMGYGPNNHFHTTFDTSTTTDAKRGAAVLQSMLRQAYIDVDIVTSDGQFFYKKLQEGQFDFASAAWIGDFDDAGTFLDLLQSESGNNYGKYDSPDFDALLAKSYNTLDAKQRGEYLRQAEQTALDDLAVIPGRFLVTQDIVEPYVKGWVPNVRDFNRSRWLWIDPDAAPERGN
jgi:oligopeptide transport system substrate-binding protein